MAVQNKRHRGMQVARVDGRYDLKGKLGSGSYATVYRAEDIITNDVVALKFETIKPESASPLEHEYAILKQLQGGVGLPEALWLGTESTYRVMVLESLGPSLDVLLRASPGGFSMCRVAEIGLQMVTRLEYVHSHNLVHRDLKPHNILMGSPKLKDTFFLIDFGIAKYYRHPSSRTHIPMAETHRLIGTPAFTSLNSHSGQELSRRDDIEALAYTLLFLHNGSLPWLSDNRRCNSSRSSVQKLKQSLEISPEVPVYLATFLRFARGMSFTQKPNYDYLRAILLPATTSLSAVTRETCTLSILQVDEDARKHSELRALIPQNVDYARA